MKNIGKRIDNVKLKKVLFFLIFQQKYSNIGATGFKIFVKVRVPKYRDYEYLHIHIC